MSVFILFVCKWSVANYVNDANLSSVEQNTAFEINVWLFVTLLRDLKVNYCYLKPRKRQQYMIVAFSSTLTSVPLRLRSHLLLLPTIRADCNDLSARDSTQFTCNWLLVQNTSTNWRLVKFFWNSLRNRLYYSCSVTSKYFWSMPFS